MTEFAMNPITPGQSNPIQGVILSGQNSGLYSSSAQKEARETLDKFVKSNSSGTPRRSRRLCHNSFEAISRDSETTPLEKSLSEIGLQLGGTKSSKEHAEACKIILHSIASQLPGPAGQIVADISSSILSVSKDPDLGNKAMKSSLEVIAGSPDTSPEEKLFAQFGLDFATKVLSNPSRIAVRSAILKKIGEGVPNQPVSALASMVLDINKGNILSSSDALLVIRQGFDYIKNDPTASEYERTIAKLGSEISFFDAKTEEISIIREKLLESLVSPGPEKEPYATSKVLYDISKISTITELPGRELLLSALSHISRHPRSSPMAKQLASYGVNLAKSCNNSNSVTARQKILDTIFSQPRDGYSRILSGMICDLAKTPGFTEDAVTTFLTNAFDSIKNDPDALPKSSELAKKGIIIGHTSLPNVSNLNQQRLKIMEEIHTIEKKAFDERSMDLAKMLESAKNPGKRNHSPEEPTLVNNPTSVDLGGVELKKRVKRF